MIFNILQIKKIFLISFLLLLFNVSFSQFYNGHQMNFGKSRVQYGDFYWHYYRFDRFDVYFHVDGDEHAEFIARNATKKITEIENFFGYSLNKRIIFVVYNKLSDFRQSNIGLLTSGEESNTGGVMKIIDNKVFIYFENDHSKFQQQLNEAITEVVFTEMIYGGSMREKFTSSTLLNMPEWYTSGLISYISKDWDFEIDNRVKDGILSGRYKKINRLTGEDAICAGHSLWKYIGDTYGKSVIPNIVYLAKINKSAGSGFLFVLGQNLKDITPSWLDYYKSRYQNESNMQTTADSVKILKRTKSTRDYYQMKMSPDGKHIAYVTNENSKYIIWLYNEENQKIKKIYKLGNKFDQIPDYSYPILSWQSSSKVLGFITEEQGNIYLSTFDTESGQINRRLIPNYDKILDFSYSPAGKDIVFSAVRKGFVDIYTFNLVSGLSKRITHDLADDLKPRFVDNGARIIFQSNRVDDTIRVQKQISSTVTDNYDLFIYDYSGKSKLLTRITDTKYVNETQPIELASNIFAYLSEENGINNRHIAKFDSTINYIDTITHYRFFTRNYPLTNYSQNIREHDVNSKNMKYAEILFSDEKYKLLKNELVTKRNELPGTYKNTSFRESYNSKKLKEDSLAIIAEKEENTLKPIEIKPVKEVIAPPKIFPDSILIDINHYIFERERYKDYYSQLVKPQEDVLSKKKFFTLPQKMLYKTTFFTNYIVNQVDFNFLSDFYQTFSGGESPYYFNPGFNLLFKIGTNDLFEDYRIVGGVRLSANFDSEEYMLSVEDLRKRWDKQFFYLRQSYDQAFDYNYTAKTISQELIYSLKYPFSPVHSIKAYAIFRYDHYILLSSGWDALRQNDIHEFWGGIKIEQVFDNTRSLGLNLYEYTRGKTWFEAYRPVENNGEMLFVVGTDYRHYTRISRNLIWANRFAASTSFGGNKLVYYLGGVDNWITTNRNKMFNVDVEVSKTEGYAFQAVATNMRGFSQNIRNGNSFAVANTEIRWPIFSYFSERPLNSDFLNNFQVIGFADIGTAFTGLSPRSAKNAYNKEIIENGPITVVIDHEKSVFVAGYGLGVRSRVFGYFARLDWSWGIDDYQVLPRLFYFSLNLDF